MREDGCLLNSSSRAMCSALHWDVKDTPRVVWCEVLTGVDAAGMSRPLGKSGLLGIRSQLSAQPVVSSETLE